MATFTASMQANVASSRAHLEQKSLLMATSLGAYNALGTQEHDRVVRDTLNKDST